MPKCISIPPKAAKRRKRQEKLTAVMTLTKKREKLPAPQEQGKDCGMFSVVQWLC